MYDERIVLIHEEKTQNTIGEFIVEECKRSVWAEISSVTRNEFFAAGERGMRAEYVARLPIFNYHGEEEVEYRKKRYAVYRTYENCNTEEIELYLEYKVGRNG